MDDLQVWAFEDLKDFEFLNWLCTRLYSENRMTGDNMRDAAQRLKLLIDRLEVITIKE